VEELMMLDRLSFRWLLFVLASLQPEAELFLLEARARPVVSRTTGHTPQLSAHARSDEVLPSRGEAFRRL
jgi:hypothetical protein